MKNKQLLLLLLIAGLFLQLKCRKNTEPAGYYFECKVDGKLYIPDGFCGNCKVATILNDTVLLLSGKRSIEIVAIGITDKSGIKQATYVLSNMLGTGAAYKNSTTTDDRFDTDATRIGKLIIKRLDKVTREIEGTFYFEAYNPVQNRIIDVTDGKFKLKYITY